MIEQVVYNCDTIMNNPLNFAEKRSDFCKLKVYLMLFYNNK